MKDLAAAYAKLQADLHQERTARAKYQDLCEGMQEQAEADQIRIEALEEALKDVIGMLDDPHGGEHVRDMRGAALIARKALER